MDDTTIAFCLCGCMVVYASVKHVWYIAMSL